ncbi:AAEL001286-PA [Aedes aegypti]|uniref:AAEL001286-PA n=1 Tax=Aedes aegypti TaxID=7159 RepID=Q17LQ5_AEDAE|nr:AAEL001286-PA [Aedes aegypti]
MMMIVAILAVLCGVSAGYSLPAPNAYMYYQRPVAYRTVHSTMYGLQHFRNQQFRNQRVSDLAPGIHPNDCQHSDFDTAENPNAESDAAAHPAEQFPAEEDMQQNVSAIYEDVAGEPTADESLSVPAAPAMIPKKKNRPVPAQVDSDEEEEQDAEVGRRRADDSGASNAFFPINFGSANGGAIAIANSYSTGKGGSATSTSIAYGSPASEELPITSASQLRKRPAKFRGRQ